MKFETCRELLVYRFVKSAVSTYKYLGVTIDSELKWEQHVKCLVNKMNSRMYFLYKLNNFKIDKTICHLFYRAVIESLFTFCITAWGGNCSQRDQSRIVRIIKRAEKMTNINNIQFNELYEKCCL